MAAEWLLLIFVAGGATAIAYIGLKASREK